MLTVGKVKLHTRKLFDTSFFATSMPMMVYEDEHFAVILAQLAT